jgi:diacylglycerol kinase (ATP)
MNGTMKFSLAHRLKSVRCACHGIFIMLKHEHNAWIHTLATFMVCGAGLYAGLTRYDWCWIVLAIVAVWTAEALNTAFEFLADVTVPKFHPMVEKGKDVAAGAVFIASIGAVVIAVLVFGQYFVK